MPKSAKPSFTPHQLRDKFLERVSELWDMHEHEFMEVLDESESKKINLTFKAAIDTSETAAKLATHISFSQVVKEAREDVFDDPGQPWLTMGEPEASDTKPAGKKSGKGRSAEFVAPTAEAE